MRRQLGQLRPANTTAAALVTPDDSRPYSVDFINICNVSTGTTAYVYIYHDEDGTTYDETTALIWNMTVHAGETLQIEAPIAGYKVAGRLAVKTSVANAITFTAYGERAGERL